MMKISTVVPESVLATLPVDRFPLQPEDTVIPTSEVIETEVRPGAPVTTYRIKVCRERLFDGIVYRKEIYLPLKWFANPSHDTFLDVVEDIVGKRFEYRGWPDPGEAKPGQRPKPIFQRV